MAHVFVSYTRDDEPKARQLVTAQANLAGWSGDVRETDYLSLIDAIDRLVPRPVKAGGRAENPPPPVAPERPDQSPYAKGPLARVVAAIRQLSARSTLLLSAAAIVATLAAAWWYLDRFSSTPRHTYRQLDVTVKLGDWMYVRALYGTAAFYARWPATSARTASQR